MANSAAVCGLKPFIWIGILSFVVVSAIIAIAVGVTQTDKSTTTPGGIAVNPSGTPQPTPTPKPATPAPTPSPPTSPPTQPPGPLRGLPTADFTIFHISDLHGAIGVKGHSPSYKEFNNGQTMTLDADWGDMLSMVAAARENAAASNTSEFLIFDTGDIVDGTPYSDATSPRGVNMITAISQAHYDGFAPGNHDLGYADTISLLHNTTDQLNTITSNIDYQGKPLGSSYRVLQMKSGWRVLVLGFIFDFTPSGPDATVTNITSGQLLKDIKFGGELIPKYNASRVFTNQQYFKDAMAVPNIDLVITIGHISMSPNTGSVDYWDEIKKAIRKLKPHTPIIQLGGHTHRDQYTLNGISSVAEMAQYPPKEQASITSAIVNPIGDAPGHFGMETTNAFQAIGTLKFQLGDHVNASIGGQRITNLKVNWIHTNVAAMAAFVNRSISNFTIPAAIDLKSKLRSWATQYNFTTIWGCWNGTTLVTNGPDPDPTNTYLRNNVYLWYMQTLMPTYFDPNASNPNIPFYLASSSSLRGTLYHGNVTEEDLANILPFDDDFMYFKGLNAQTFQWALFFTMTKFYGSAGVRKHTECVHDGDVFPAGSRVAHTPSGTYVMSFEEGPGMTTEPRKRLHRLSSQLGDTPIIYNCTYNQQSTIPCSSDQNTMKLSSDTHPYMYYSSNIPVLQPVPEMRGRTSFTYADIAGAYPTPYTKNNDIDWYLLATNATARIAIRDAFLTQYANATFDLITTDYFAQRLYQGSIFAKGGSKYGFPSTAPLYYPGNTQNYPGAPIKAIAMLHQYVNKYLTCPFPTPYTPPVA